jgi:hypothetical protein
MFQGSVTPRSKRFIFLIVFIVVTGDNASPHRNCLVGFITSERHAADTGRCWKDCGLQNLPFASFTQNLAWVGTSLIAGALIA